MTIPDLLRELDITYTEAGNSKYVRDGWIGITCPYCQSGNAMGIHLSGSGASCWKCGSDHKLTAVLADASGLNRGTIWALLEKVGLGSTKAARTPSRGHLELPKGIVEGPLPPAHRKYLQGRNFHDVDQLSKDYGLRGIGIAARLGWTIWFPITLRGKVVSWGTRSLSDKGLRYITAAPHEEAFPHKRLLYNMDRAKDTIIVVEGVIDVWAIGPGAVCTFGLSFTPAQVRLMSEFSTRVIAFDSEPIAQRQARRLADQLASFDGRTFKVELSTGKDAATANRSELAALRRMFLD